MHKRYIPLSPNKDQRIFQRLRILRYSKNCANIESMMHTTATVSKPLITNMQSYWRTFFAECYLLFHTISSWLRTIFGQETITFHIPSQQILNSLPSHHTSTPPTSFAIDRNLLQLEPINGTIDLRRISTPTRFLTSKVSRRSIPKLKFRSSSVPQWEDNARTCPNHVLHLKESLDHFKFPLKKMALPGFVSAGCQ